MKSQSRLYYDARCGLCRRVVGFISRHDDGGIVHLPLSELTDDVSGIDTVVYQRGHQRFYESMAILEVARDMGFPFSCLYVFRRLPPKWRDGLYRYVAKRRYLLWGKIDNGQCDIATDPLPSRVNPEINSRP